jgi:flagellin-like protein
MARARDRGASSVIGVVLMVAVTIVLAAAVGAFVLDVHSTRASPPQIANADAELTNVHGSSTDQTVRITHRGGDTVDVADLEIVVSFSNSSKRSRLVGIPTDTIDPADYEGDDVWDGSGDGIGGAIATDEPAGSDGEWSSGEAIAFRIAKGNVELYQGDTVTVRIVHEPSGTVLIERTISADVASLQPVPDLTDEATASIAIATDAARQPDARVDATLATDSRVDATLATDSRVDATRSLEVRGDSTVETVVFVDPEHSTTARHSHASTTAASRSCAVAYETVAGCPPGWP